MSMKGIDISNWQAGLRLDGSIDFAIIKATEGIGFVDIHCDGFVTQSIDCGICWGFYHFACENDPIAEADFFIENCVNYFGLGLPVLDYEIANPEPLGMKPAEWVEQFCKRVYEKTKVCPLVYCSALAYPYNAANIGGDWTHEHCGLWLAGYPDTRNTWRDDSPPYDTAPWDFCAIWQFTNSCYYNGMSVDGDVAYMDAQAWKKYVAGDRTNDSSDSAAEKPTTTIPNTIAKNLNLDAALERIAIECINGAYGNGETRKERLFDAVQEKVNKLINPF